MKNSTGIQEIKGAYDNYCRLSPIVKRWIDKANQTAIIDDTQNDPVVVIEPVIKEKLDLICDGKVFDYNYCTASTFVRDTVYQSQNFNTSLIKFDARFVSLFETLPPEYDTQKALELYNIAKKFNKYCSTIDFDKLK